MVCLQSSIVHFWRKSHFIPCEIGLYDGILEFGKMHFSLERVCLKMPVIPQELVAQLERIPDAELQELAQMLASRLENNQFNADTFFI